MVDDLLIISGSNRKKGDTDRCINLTFRDIKHSKIDLIDYIIAHYSYMNNYSEEDDFLYIIEQFLKYDTIVFATPVYWYAMSGIMKVFFDRLTDLVTVRKEIGRRLKNKSVFLLSTGTDKDLPHGFEIPFKLTSNYFGWSYNSCLYLSTEELSSMDMSKNAFFTTQIQLIIQSKKL